MRDTDPRHTWRWTVLSRRLRVTTRRCQECGDPRSAADLTVDHIVPVSEDPARAFDPTNLRVVCRSCHAQVDPAFGPGYRGRG